MINTEKRFVDTLVLGKGSAHAPLAITSLHSHTSDVMIAQDSWHFKNTRSATNTPQPEHPVLVCSQVLQIC